MKKHVNYILYTLGKYITLISISLVLYTLMELCYQGVRKAGSQVSCASADYQLIINTGRWI